ncbi:hypothetical protein SAMN02745121_04711 [Nannocystis exedens]|uniref:Uncharacterized protein n=1 Tax=Nannocystis exedens TaxID=54 RepID=A0A1I2BJ46_9BACT|nr:hypothetical protein [Nannocystis exedens]PCC67946.1 hypothetical protein NAEX_00954 [Nannocystis exedens]SFE56212.1 hypothetical protein SAMN02745121_04711 [Nannocystis exedens]
MSVRRCALAFAVLPLLPGCFKDDGAALTQTAGSLEPSTSTGADPSTTTTGALDSTTTSGGSESAAATGEPVTTGTTAAPLCPGEMQCTPDEVMDTGALCDPCGRLRRTCQADCTWGPDECVEDASSCAYWYLDDPRLGWQRVALPQPPPRHAPAAPAIAAFDLRAHDRIVVLTETTYHVLQGSDQTWLASGPRSDVFPDLPFSLLQSYAVHNAEFDTYDVYAVGDPLAWIYTLAIQPDGFTSQYALEGPCCSSFTPLVSPGSPAAVRDLYVDLDAPFPYVSGEFYATCIEEFALLGSYAAWLTPTDVYVQDVALCFQMVAQSSLAAFAPFAAPGAPPGERLGGAAMLGERLYVFAGD